MPTDHVPGKPRIGTFVDYYDPRILQRIGMTEGAGKRYDGPYAAVVTNNVGNGLTLFVYMPGWAPVERRDVPHKDSAAAFVATDGTNHPTKNNEYWDWQTPIQSARAAKEVKSGESAH